MSNQPHSNRRLSAGLFLAIFAAVLWIGHAEFVNAEHGGRYYDGRHGHNHYYPQRGVYVGSVPRGYRVLPYGGVNYYYARGVWYRPYGARFIVVGPPIGVVVPILPPYYATIWWGGVPYYYANDVYYSQAPGGYMVVNPPPGVVSQSPPPGAVPPSPETAEKMFIYPRQVRPSSRKQPISMLATAGPWARPATTRPFHLAVRRIPGEIVNTRGPLGLASIRVGTRSSNIESFEKSRGERSRYCRVSGKKPA